MERRVLLTRGVALAGACACGVVGPLGCVTRNEMAWPVAARQPNKGRSAIGAAGDLAVGDQLKVTAPTLDDTVLVARVSEREVKGASVSCTHWGSEVVLALKEKRFRCENHGSEFAYDGAVLEGPADEPLPTYEVAEEDGDLYLVIPGG